MVKSILLIAAVCIFCSAPSQAQTKYDFPQFWSETGQFFSMPAKWTPMDWGTLALMTGLTAVAMKGEMDVRDIKFIDRAFYNSPEAVAGKIYGELYTPFIIFGAYAGYSLATGDHTARKIGYEIGQACLYSAAIVFTMKSIIGRARPIADEGKFSFHPFTFSPNWHDSFPSGHTTEAFTMSSVLSMNAHSTWLKILAYVPAFFTPFSRAYQGWHWISDCVFGAGIGFFTAKWVTDHHEANEAAAAASTTAKRLTPPEVRIIHPITFTYTF